MLQRLTGLLTTRRSDERRMAARIPDGQRVYAIGDIHGRSDLLVELLGRLKADALGFEGEITLVCVGDYIDRGPDSKGVVDVLLAEIPASWKTVFLRGNHEQAMLDFLAEPATRGEWLAWGGMQALESYGVAPYGARGIRDVAALAAEMRHALEECGQMGFFEKTELAALCGDYMFVHAGVRSGIAADRQMAEDLLFIREDFLGRPHNLPYRVVFGHTIFSDPVIEDDRIGLDTGAFQTGILTALRLEDAEVEVFQTGVKAAAA